MTTGRGRNRTGDCGPPRSHGFVAEDLIEIQAPRPAHRDYGEVSVDWAHIWPSEEAWKARLES